MAAFTGNPPQNWWQRGDRTFSKIGEGVSLFLLMQTPAIVNQALPKVRAPHYKSPIIANANFFLLF